MKFTEEKLEQAFTELLTNEGFVHCLGNTITRAADEVIIEDDLIQIYLDEELENELSQSPR